MVKAIVFFKRRAGMTVEEFQAYWRHRHPDVVMKLSGIRRYVQSHPHFVAYQCGEPVYDGIAELWFEHTAAMHALRGTPEWAAVQADETRFIDQSTLGLIIANDVVIKDAAVLPGMAKAIGFLRRKPGMPVEAFQQHWREVHGPLEEAIPGLRRYVQSHPRLRGYDGGREPAWDGIPIIWFDDPTALRVATATPEWGRANADDANFIAPGPAPFIIATEYVISG